MSITYSQVHNAKLPIMRAGKWLAEARAFPTCAALVALLEERVATFEAIFARYEARESDVPAADEALRAAEIELKRAREVPHVADRAGAIEREGDIVWAINVLHVRQRERADAVREASNPLARLTSHRDDAARQAESAAESLMTVCLGGPSKFHDFSSPLMLALDGKYDVEKCNDEELAFQPLYEARALARYKAEAKSRANPKPYEVLRDAFAERAKMRAPRLEKLLVELQARAADRPPPRPPAEPQVPHRTGWEQKPPAGDTKWR